MNCLPKKKVVSLRMSVIICFVLMTAAMVIPAAQCAYQLSGYDTRKGTAYLTNGRLMADHPDASGVITGIEMIRNQLLAEILAVLVCMSGVCFFFLKNIAFPIHRMAAATRMMAEGRLDITVPSDPRNEIGEIGGVINDLAVNLQEVLLHVWHHTAHSMECLGRINDKLKNGSRHGLPHKIEEDVADVSRNIQDIQDLVRTFDYYDIQLENGRILAAETHPSQRPSGDLKDRPPRWDLENIN